jgi:rRNA-processing protein FCF1
MIEVFIDQQSLGLRKYLQAAGLRLHDDSEIRGSNKTSVGVPDEKVLEFLDVHPDLILVTKDRGLAKKGKTKGLKVIFVDESEAVAIEALRQLATGKY